MRVDASHCKARHEHSAERGPAALLRLWVSGTRGTHQYSARRANARATEARPQRRKLPMKAVPQHPKQTCRQRRKSRSGRAALRQPSSNVANAQQQRNPLRGPQQPPRG